MSAEVRTRFAPSPTGSMHAGGVRTTIFGWALARHFGGKFILRIEDTDRERLVPGAIKSIIEDLQWLNLDIDEGPSTEELLRCDPTFSGTGIGGPYGPYVQSLRLSRYQEIAEKLVTLGKAYRCDCTAEMLEQERLEQMARKEPPGYSGYCRHRNVSADSKHVVRLKIDPKQSLRIDDAIRGPIVWDNISLKDPVLLKSDGFPTYHLAVVVDDHDMKISHITRAQEWISTTPIHVLLYQALEWEMPIFCHFPNVLGNDGKKLSKRHGATQIESFKEAGYLPEAFFNFLVLIGWSPGDGDNQEVMTRSELISKFSLKHVNSAAGVFAYEKLDWMNGVYIRNMEIGQLVSLLVPYLKKAGLNFDLETLTKIVPHIRERINKLTEAASLIDFLFVEDLARDLKSMYKKGIDEEKAMVILNSSLKSLSSLISWEVSDIEGALRAIAEELSMKVGPMFGVIRIAVTGKAITPPLFESLVVLGREKTLLRIEETMNLIKSS